MKAAPNVPLEVALGEEDVLTTDVYSQHCPGHTISQRHGLPVVLYNALRYPGQPLATSKLHTSPQAEISET